jgi:hypothetical protein
MEEKKNYPIEGYRYCIFSSVKSSGTNAIIDLIHGNRRLARLHFTNEYSLDKASRSKSGEYELHFAYEDFDRVIDLLRNEGPCYLLWRGPEETRISSGPEAVGEGESGPA